ncbi:MAG: hypothetical protein ACOYYS_25225 [Chloroflexota bacterium]
MKLVCGVYDWHRIFPACCLIVGLWALAGCRFSAATTDTPAAPTSTIWQPTHIPTPSARERVSFEGVGFDYEPSLAQEVHPSVVPAYIAPGFTSSPEYIKFDFSGYPAQNDAQAPRIEVYAVEAYADLSSSFRSKAEQLKRFLAEKPVALPADAEIPVLIFSDVTQVVRVQVAYLPFQNGSGVRFIAAYKQVYDPPITNSRIFYVFQGFTDDGKFYVIAIFPVAADILFDSEKSLSPDQQAQLVKQMDDFDAYVEETTQRLEKLAPRDFLPNLSLLDALLQSLHIQ